MRLKEDRDNVAKAKDALELEETGAGTAISEKLNVGWEELVDLKGVWQVSLPKVVQSGMAETPPLPRRHVGTGQDLGPDRRDEGPSLAVCTDAKATSADRRIIHAGDTSINTDFRQYLKCCFVCPPLIAERATLSPASVRWLRTRPPAASDLCQS